MLVLGALWGQARVNFLLTAAVRQRVVERVVQHQIAQPDGTVVTEMSLLERMLVGHATAYQDGQRAVVYFDVYKSPLEAAFVVYTHHPSSTDFGTTIQFVPLAPAWFFFRRGYAG